MNLITQIANDVAVIGSFVADTALTSKEKLAVEIAAKWVAFAAQSIDKMIAGGVKLEDLRVDTPDERIAKYLADNRIK